METATKNTYTSYQKEIKGNTWSILVTTGRNFEIMVTKKTNNPFGGRMGKIYRSFDEATQAYKSGDMKLFILEVETGLAPQHGESITA